MPRQLAHHLQNNEPMYQALEKNILRERRKLREQKEEKEREKARKEKELQEQQEMASIGEKLTGLKGVKHQLITKLRKLIIERENRRKKQNEGQNTVTSDETELQNVAIPGPSNSSANSSMQHVCPNPNCRFKQIPQKRPRSSFPHPSPGPSYSGLAVRPGPPHQLMNQPYMYDGRNTNSYAGGQYYPFPYRPAVQPVNYGGAVAIQHPQTETRGIAPGYPIRHPFFPPPPQHVVPGIGYRQMQPQQNVSRRQTMAPIRGPAHFPYAVPPPIQPPKRRRLFYSQPRAEAHESRPPILHNFAGNEFQIQNSMQYLS